MAVSTPAISNKPISYALGRQALALKKLTL